MAHSRSRALLWLRLSLSLGVAHAANLEHKTQQVWVRSPQHKPNDVQIVPSLKHACDAHKLDLHKMTQVLNGELHECDGWQCGAVLASQPDTDELDDADDATDYASTPTAAAAPTMPAGGMSKMVVSFACSTIASRIVKKCDQTSPKFLPRLRLAFYAAVAVRLLVEMLVEMRIRAADDQTILPSPSATTDPIGALLSGLRGKATEKTVQTYDTEQLRSWRKSYRLGTAFVFFMHLWRKWTQILAYTAASNLVDTFYHPLVQVHLLRRPAVGTLKRPFSAGPSPLHLPAASRARRRPAGLAAARALVARAGWASSRSLRRESPTWHRPKLPRRRRLPRPTRSRVILDSSRL